MVSSSAWALSVFSADDGILGYQKLLQQVGHNDYNSQENKMEPRMFDILDSVALDIFSGIWE